ncbi:hypothetical protein L3V77_18410 [Vibrio sp. DW001]|uniref:hypothetical protein n=1 Tax=Vibrio sp. DW001 TaxID=2912315 RepID=UPI0023B1B3A1|nr:hypothetical protein [Vibrio sp. DW001]WED29403.1 hypothetical protein L3V77_18410 [Vibrio sp. DW001]
MKSHIEIAKDAISVVTPSIEKLFERTNRQELHIVIMDPRLKPWDTTFKEAILHQASLGQPESWTIPFDKLARKKAKQAWCNNNANIQTQLIHPSSLQEDDILYFGSFVYGDIVVGCSGVQQWYDMLISGWIAVAFEQLAMHEYQTSKIDNPTQTYRNYE